MRHERLVRSKAGVDERHAGVPIEVVNSLDWMDHECRKASGCVDVVGDVQQGRWHIHHEEAQELIWVDAAEDQQQGSQEDFPAVDLADYLDGEATPRFCQVMRRGGDLGTTRSSRLRKSAVERAVR